MFYGIVKYGYWSRFKCIATEFKSNVASGKIGCACIEIQCAVAGIEEDYRG